jgi:hypothetical protein
MVVVLCHVQRFNINMRTKKARQKKQVSTTMAFCCQLLLLARPAASRYVMLLPLATEQRQ